MKTQDYTYHYRGYWSDGGVCRVRLYEKEGHGPLFVVSELPENENTSITNLAEYLAAELRQRHLLGRYENPVFSWVEHYPRTAEDQRDGLEETWSLIHFASYEITQTARWGGGVMRAKIGLPQWLPLTAEEVAQLVAEYD